MNSYTYFLSTDFPQNSVDSDLLIIEIGNSSIVTGFLYVSTSGDSCVIWFSSALSGAEETTLDAIVAAHQPQVAPEAVIDLKNDVVVDVTWADFKKYLDGTIASLYFFTQIMDDRYLITTEAHGGFKHQYVLLFSALADKTDFETNFQPNQDTRQPNERLQFTEKNAAITYLPNGDIDKVETIVGSRKEIKQLNYSLGSLVSVTTTIVDV